MAKRSIRDIITDWGFFVWRDEAPSNLRARQDAYQRLYTTFKLEGYTEDDITISDENFIREEFTVGSKKRVGSNWDRFNKAAKAHQLEAKKRVFGPGFIASSEESSSGKPYAKNRESLDISNIANSTSESSDAKEKRVPEENEKPSKYKLYEPDPKEIEKINQLFKFDGFTDEDLE